MNKNRLFYLGMLLLLSVAIMAFTQATNLFEHTDQAMAGLATEPGHTIGDDVGKGASADKFELFVSDANNFDKGPWKILRYDSDGINPRVFTEEQLGWPQDIVVLEEEAIVLISNLTTGKINRHKLSDGAYLGEFANVPGAPTRTKFGPDGLLYILQWQGNGKVQRFRRDGTFVDEFTDLGVNQSIGLDWDADGNLYVSSFGNKHIRKFDRNGKDMGLFVSTDMAGPTDIAFTKAGELLVNDWKAGLVLRFSKEGTLLGQFSSGVSQAEGLTTLPNGNILIGNGAGSNIKEYDPTGGFVRDLVPKKAGGLSQPNAVTVRVIPK